MMPFSNPFSSPSFEDEGGQTNVSISMYKFLIKLIGRLGTVEMIYTA